MSCRSFRSPLLSLLVVALAGTAISGEPPVIDHLADVRFELDTHRVFVADRLDVPPGVASLRLNADMTIDEIRVIDNTVVDPRAVSTVEEDEDGLYRLIHLDRMGMGDGGVMLLVYSGEFHASVDDVVFSRENVGREIEATVGDEGIYLSASAEWLAWAEGAMATHNVLVDTPAGFESVTQGRREGRTEIGDRLRTRWIAPHPSDGLNLIANRYVVHEEPVRDGVTAYTFFLEDDARLRETYMERTRAYVTMYEEMIGPYPYTKFATVENWFPTGYGMPSYTLLGGQVLRLPFIPYTSFGHEIAHNWWGNSVFVDIEEGNWCEGLTSYCADYHYKTLESDDAAREYRRNLLKDYAAYVRDPERDFPLNEFLSRHSGATRAVGYGKSMMVFHMLDRMVGREAFLAGLREVAAEFRFREAAWSDFLAAFARHGGRDLDGFADQWLTRTGAPVLELGDVRFGDDEVVFELTQSEPAYRLEVPVVLTTADGPVERTVVADGPSTSVTLAVAGARRLAVDPDCHLFRRLDPAEIEPTLSRILGEEDPWFALGETDEAMTSAVRRFAAGFLSVDEDEAPAPAEGSVPGRAGVLVNPTAAQLASLETPGLEIAGGMVFLAGKRHDLKTNDLVFAAADPGQPGNDWLVIVTRSPDRLASLARRVVHYGKYSWLVMPTGGGRPLRGNWEPGASPLVAER